MKLVIPAGSTRGFFLVLYSIMFRPHTILGFGLWLIAISFLGIGDNWKIRLYVLTGIFFVLAYLFRLGRIALLRLAEEGVRDADSFVENGNGISKSQVGDVTEKTGV